MNLASFFDKRSRVFKLSFGIALIGVIGIVDYLTGYELAFLLFYILPVGFVTWYTDRPLGILASFISAGVSIDADLAAGYPHSHPLFFAWDIFLRISFFLIVTFLLSAVRNGLERERSLARVDFLTGALNTRSFYELTQMEIDRLRRYGHPFTLAYLDIDNFKTINDRLGHAAGDEALRKVATCTRANLRKTDAIARLGGDEFAVLLPETDQDSAAVVFAKIQRVLDQEVQRNGWPITFSVGVLTCRAAPASIDTLVSMADEMMYTVKRGSKNGIKYSAYAG